ncbi:isocitrate dehydrogenase [candidate division WOR-1 bacterium RIFOXYA12_FULL_43_27]|uniref:Isocitrate dehydrogenase n=1 Tax=candidate division WOR-1 bacterium RIFOXYC2_FULL_46_14 TaxID=1802587 RepID=A0A1F4U896_UNCSA|nr:MAG: isocitrate dehydrogenase [candidate division WOR-1 bacterium RIFOXYA12_FULL_43_27]OGC20002.1 MAG: isocitrate dehydrogenase [candidate division WOR-1 bacterium RIFOXYB2_FULL_46_45]OGC32261.1 MAG: isocitrate dehydrogenase [candidate division WOR-1 bacterium RIFOXYA2_FULL_46_56]OGC41165.1 MAG: isocitrate dehydrogenase [candidate division WOR-1 bacterium RIFOXYC2_FULL_46_14]
MAYTVTLIPGDGIGPEISEAAKRCIDATGVKINWEIEHAGVDIMEKAGTPLPDSVIASIKKNKVALKGPITTPIGTGFRSVNVAIRQILGLYACLRPAKSYVGVRSRYEKIDLVIVRENTEDLYAGIEFEHGKKETLGLIDYIEKSIHKKILPSSGISIKPISKEGTEKLVKFAFDYAVKHNRKKVTAVTKANIMKFTDGYFYAIAREVAKAYPKIEYEERLIDNMCMQLVQKPELYDVLALPNLYGDIISDLCAGLIGGLGIAPGANIGEGMAVFEAVHGSAPKYKGKNVVNPTAMILSGVLMLDYLGEKAAAQKLESAVAAVIAEGKDVTYDMKPHRDDPSAVGTSQMADAIIAKVKNA